MLLGNLHGFEFSSPALNHCERLSKIVPNVCAIHVEVDIIGDVSTQSGLGMKEFGIR